MCFSYGTTTAVSGLPSGLISAALVVPFLLLFSSLHMDRMVEPQALYQLKRCTV